MSNNIKADLVVCSIDFLDSLLPGFSLNSIQSVNDKQNLLLINDAFTENYSNLINPDNENVINIDRKVIENRIDGTVTLKELVNGIPVPIFLKDVNGHFLGCNPSFTMLFGFEEYDLIGKTSYDISPINEADEYVFRDKEILKHQGTQVYEGTMTNKHGVVNNVIFRKSVLKNPDGAIVAIVGVIIDITKRKKIEESLWEYRNKLHEMVLKKTSDITMKNQLLEQEIVKRKKSESDLIQQEYLLRTILNSTYDAIIVFDIDGKIITVNNKMMDMFKVKHPFVYNLSFFDDLSSDQNPEVITDKWQSTINDEEQFFEWYAKTPYDNQVFVTEIFLRKIILNSKIHILANIRDITNRKNTEKMLLQEHKKVKIALKHEMLISTIATVLNSTEEFFKVIDYVLNIISTTLNIDLVQFVPFINEQNDELQNKQWLNISYAEFLKCFPKNHSNIDIITVSNNHLITTLLSKIMQSISVFWIDLSETVEINRKILESHSIKSFAAMPLKLQYLSVVQDSKNKFNKVSGMLTFESKESNMWTSKHYSLFNTIANMIANAWGRHLQTIARINAEKKTAESVQLLENSSRLASIGVMAAGITHEINQPLNAIKVSADSILFQNKRMPGMYPEILINKLNNISLATNRIDDIIKHMKSFWTPSEKSHDSRFEIHEAICQAISIMQKQMTMNNIVLKLSFLKQFNLNFNNNDLLSVPMYIKGNRIHFEQIIINLLVNSYHSLEKVSNKEKCIKIDTEILSDYYLIRITDNGIGLPDNFEDKLFDPFFSTKKPGKGMGLGLAIVKFFIDNFKGNISAYNRTDESGACFELSFIKE